MTFSSHWAAFTSFQIWLYSVAPRNVFPEIYPRLVVVQVVQMQILLFFGRQILRDAWVHRQISGDSADLLLRFRLDHVLKKLMRQFLMFARGGNHQMIYPARGVFFRNGLADGEVVCAVDSSSAANPWRSRLHDSRTDWSARRRWTTVFGCLVSTRSASPSLFRVRSSERW